MPVCAPTDISPTTSLDVVGVTGVTMGELGRRVEDLERITSSLERTTIRLSTMAELRTKSEGHWWSMAVALVAAGVGSTSALVVTLVH